MEQHPIVSRQEWLEAHCLDIMPKGRDEADDPNWLRRRDEYDGGSGSAPRQAADA